MTHSGSGCKVSASVWETRVRSLGQKDPLEKEMATHSSTLVWKISWTEEPCRLWPMGLQRVGHDRATSLTHSSLTSADDNVVSDSQYGTTCSCQASGSLLYFDKSIRSAVFSFPHPDLPYLICDYIVTCATFLSLFLIFLNPVCP